MFGHEAFLAMALCQIQWKFLSFQEWHNANSKRFLEQKEF